MLHIEPLTLAEANALVLMWHRHHKRCVGHRFSIGVFDHEGRCHGAAIIGRPVGGSSDGVDQSRIAEVSRLVTDGTYNACSILYAAAARAARAMGYRWIQTFILSDEPGTSLKASGWRFVRLSHPIGWNNGNRPRNDVVDAGRRKQLWRLELNPAFPSGRNNDKLSCDIIPGDPSPPERGHSSRSPAETWLA